MAQILRSEKGGYSKKDVLKKMDAYGSLLFALDCGMDSETAAAELENIKTMPLIVYLHGAGERGTDIEKLNTHGPIKEMLAGKVKSNFIVIAPQCEEIKTWWDYAEILYKWILEFLKNRCI